MNGRPGRTPCSTPKPAATRPAAVTPPATRNVRRVGTPASVPARRPVDELGERSARRGRPVDMSRKTLATGLLVAACTACAAGPALVEPVETTAASAPAGPTLVEPVEILRGWDADRARAWARGDLHLLRALYTPGSVAGRHDRAMLRAWTGRGLVVHRLRTQLISVRPIAHSRSSWTLVVTDRLVDGVAVGAGVRRPLPRDQATTRTVQLRRLDGRWRVASVLPGEVGP